MSSALEPPTTAKVVLHTTRGPIEIELWAKEAPKATRNFLQHCLDGYFNHTIFHRVVKDFLIQAGDPTGTGDGGQSIFHDEGGFESEFHSRLRFNRRGLLGNADADKRNDNSQFFITLAATPELQRKNTLFGRVVGETIYNVLKIAEAEVDDDDRPLYPPNITHAEILVNYFDDMKPRSIAKSQQLKPSKSLKSKQKAKSRVKISFGDDDDENDNVDTALLKSFKMKPAHEILNDSRLSKVAALDTSSLPEKAIPKSAEPVNANLLPSKSSASSKSESLQESSITVVKQNDKDQDFEETPTDYHNKASSEFDRISAEIDAMKQSLKRKSFNQIDPSRTKTKLSAIDEQRQKYIKPKDESISKKKQRRKREEDTLLLLQKFTSKLYASESDSQPVTTSNNGAELESKEKLCDLHNLPNCHSCMYYDNLSDEEDDGVSGLLGHTFVDEKSTRRITRVPSPEPAQYAAGIESTRDLASHRERRKPPVEPRRDRHNGQRIHGR
ncbi:cyclophilin-like domain-containing protein [Lipomyces japonicus]|uniref:cyclophilin-like domain-containing protein n=1 Tax=Lipomyces japonicus TaxID=56871 RepID=UPI0034CF281A